MIGLWACSSDPAVQNGPPAQDGSSDTSSDASISPDAGPEPLPNFARRYGTWSPGGLGSNVPRDAIQLADREYLVSGQGWVARFDTQGDVVWQADVSTSDLTFIRPATGGFEAVGWSNFGETAIERVMISSDGQSVEQRLYSSTASERYQRATVRLQDGTTVIGGQVGIADGPLESWLMGLAADGSVPWEQRLLLPDAGDIKSLEVLADGSMLVAGGICPGSCSDPWLAKLSPARAVVWSRRWDTSRWIVADTAATPDGGAIVLGYYFPDEVSAWVARISGAGDIDWAATIGTDLQDWPASVTVREGGYLVSGVTDGVGWLVALGEDGSKQWIRSYGTRSLLRAMVADDGGLFLVGTISPGSDLWIAHTDADGRIDGADCEATTPPSLTIASATPPATSDLSITLEDISPHSSVPSSVTPAVPGLYEEARCGTGQTTQWGTGQLGDSCTCSPGSLCAGPTVGCAFGLTCVGHYSSGGTPIAECSRPCGISTGCNCVFLDVGGKVLGSWCL